MRRPVQKDSLCGMASHLVSLFGEAIAYGMHVWGCTDIVLLSVGRASQRLRGSEIQELGNLEIAGLL